MFITSLAAEFELLGEAFKAVRLSIYSTVWRVLKGRFSYSTVYSSFQQITPKMAENGLVSHLYSLLLLLHSSVGHRIFTVRQPLTMAIERYRSARLCIPTAKLVGCTIQHLPFNTRHTVASLLPRSSLLLQIQYRGFGSNIAPELCTASSKPEF